MRALVCSFACLLASCGSSPADFAGTYTINLTNGANECGVMGWTVGETSTSTIVITQREAEATVDVQGLARTYLDVVVGAHTFQGTISGDHVDATLTGRAGSEGSCAYTLMIDLSADLEGDLLTGELRWYARTNGLPECGVYNTCTNRQAFNGTRPPRGG
ncbi:MAG: hypothetical protein KF901_10200 [Myxococcales bacterium]|nr:hypothetical protein [Myxococcales bacterium]